MYRQLRSVVQQVENTPKEKLQAPVGILTTEHRDTWGPVKFFFSVYKHIILLRINLLCISRFVKQWKANNKTQNLLQTLITPSLSFALMTTVHL